MAGSDGLWYGRAFTAKPRARYRFQTIKRCQRSGVWAIACLVITEKQQERPTVTTDSFHRERSPSKYETISSYYGEFPALTRGREEAAQRVSASRQHNAIDVGCPEINPTRLMSRSSARRIASCQTRMRR